MAEKEMYDYLSNVTPDYNATLDVTPQRTLPEDISWHQIVQEADDRTEQVLTLGGPFFDIRLEWAGITPADSGTIMDFYSDPNKAKGFARSFKWDHPKDGHTYVVKFRSRLRRVYTTNMPGHHRVDALDLRVIGRIPDA